MMTKFTILTSKLNYKFTSICVNSIRRMSNIENHIIAHNINDKGILILNRPKVLNALNLSMIKKIISHLEQWEEEKSLVIVKGAGKKAFCSGGDIRAVAEAGLKGGKSRYDYFKYEYDIIGVIGAYKKPYIAFIDGIVMGGGVGISVHGQYRIATENTLFAMPETQIGLFPDVGGSYFLPRLSGKLGLYLALTGHRLKGVDVLKAGIATHYCDSKDLLELEDALLNCSNEANINVILNKFSKEDDTDFSLLPVINQINHCFSGNSVEDILLRLEKDGSKWAQDTIITLNRMSPTSLKITFKELEIGKHLSLPDCLQMEYRLAVHCLENKKDFYEGVRALVVDKDQNPKWDPPTLPEVSEELVESYFLKIPQEAEIKNKL